MQTTLIESVETMLTTVQAADILHVTPQAVAKQCRNGKIPSKLIGGMYFITVGAVRDYARQPRKPGPKPKTKLQTV